MSSTPQLRAGIPQAAWKEFTRLSEFRIGQVRQLLGDENVKLLDTALALQWVPFALEAALADAAFEILGASGARVFYRRKTVQGVNIPLLRPAAESTLRFLGATPVSVFKMAARMWAMLSRDCGRYEFVDEGEKGHGVSIVKDFPIRAYRSADAWRESCLGGYEGLFEAFHMRARVQIESVTVETGNARFAIEWNPATLRISDRNEGSSVGN
jgi:hypothetical protein